jgi:hypothetical protein
VQGVAWSSRDQFCSFYSVGVVFNEQNVWANIQKDAEPYRIDWNFHDTKRWFPFFTADFPKPPIDFPHDNSLSYKPIADGPARLLERSLDIEIKRGVEGWREYQCTSWNPEVADRLRTVLQECERAVMSDQKGAQQQAALTIGAAYANYRMAGSPFCVPYTSNQQIIEEVRLREVWKTEASEVEFALAIYVVPYPNSLAVAWVALASFEYIRPG